MVFQKLLCRLLAGGYEDYLRRAAGEGDEAHVNKLLKRGVSADPKNAHHTSPLELAAKNGHVQCVVALMDAGADANRASESSPFIQAAAHGHVDILKLMLQRKVDPTQFLAGTSALHMAARFGHQAVINALAAELDMPAAALAADKEGRTPLMLACSMPAGGEAVVEFLLGIGADPADVDKASNNALHHAAVSGNAGVAKMLVDSGKAGPQVQAVVNSNGHAPLHVAAKFGRKEVAQLLLQQKQADVVIAADKEGSTVLHLVAKSLLCDQATQLAMTQAMMQAGANPAALDAAGFTAEHYAPVALKKLLVSPARADVAAPPKPEEPVLASSSNGAAPEPQAAPAGKAQRLSLEVARAMAETGADGSESWVVKQALRRHTSEETGGWKLSTAVTEHDHNE